MGSVEGRAQRWVAMLRVSGDEVGIGVESARHRRREEREEISSRRCRGEERNAIAAACRVFSVARGDWLDDEMAD
jgi:hypothetical protein